MFINGRFHDNNERMWKMDRLCEAVRNATNQSVSKGTMKFVVALGLLTLSPVLAGAQTTPRVENQAARPIGIRELGEAQTFPVPPEQNAPFSGKDDAFGRVVKRMFEAGLADPRGLEYHEVEFFGSRLSAEKTAPSPRAFVLPSDDLKAQFAIAWNGQIYRVARVGELKDWRADLDAMKLPPATRNWHAPSGGNPTDFSTPTVLKAVLAERLGAPRTLFSQIQLKGAALPFVEQLSSRARFAHLNGDDATALALLRKEKFARDALRDVFGIAEPGVANFSAPPRPNDDNELLADQERRAKEKLAGPTDRLDTPLSRLIDDLQNVDARQMSYPGSVNFLDDERVRALVNKGEEAVPALIETIASDNRLTRSMQLGSLNPGGFGGGGQILPVSQAAYDALTEIWGVNNAKSDLFGDRYLLDNPDKRAEIVEKLRAFAAKYRGLSPLDRQFAILNDNSALPTQWLDAIEVLNRAPGEMSHSFFSWIPRTKSPSTSNKRGEALRAKQNPSLSDVVERRTAEVEQRALVSDWRQGRELMSTSNDLLLELAKWDSARALPLFLSRIKNIEQLKQAVPEDNHSYAEWQETQVRLEFLRASLSAPPGVEREKITFNYAQWLQTHPLGSLEADFYLPLWRMKDDPAFARISQSLFAAPRRPFEELLRKPKGEERAINNALSLLSTPLIGQEPFRSAVLRELNNKTPIGTLHHQSSYYQVRLTSGGSLLFMPSNTSSDSRVPEGEPVRVCDVVAARIDFPLPDGHRAPRLQWGTPQTKRDAAIAATIKGVETGQSWSRSVVDY